MAKFDATLQSLHRLGRLLDHLGLGINKREHPLCSRQTILKLAPERRDVHQWPPVEPHGHHEQVPIPRTDRPAAGGQPTGEDQNGRPHAGGDPHNGEYGVKRQATPQPHLVGLPVVGVEIVVDGPLLAEAFGHHQAADRLLDLGVDYRRHAAGTLGHRAGNPPETERDGGRNR